MVGLRAVGNSIGLDGVFASMVTPAMDMLFDSIIIAIDIMSISKNADGTLDGDNFAQSKFSLGLGVGFRPGAPEGAELGARAGDD